MAHEVTSSSSPAFPGFPDFRANVTYVPIQFFTLVIPKLPVSVVRIVGYALRKLLGWVDENGNPTREQVRITWRELIEVAGVSRDLIGDALQEAIARRFLRCVQTPQSDRPGQPARSGVYELCWDKTGPLTNSLKEFRGFYYPEAAVMPVEQSGAVVPLPKAARRNIPNAFFDFLLPREPLTIIRVVGALLFYSIEWGSGGERKVSVSKSVSELRRLTSRSRQSVHAALTQAQERGYLEQVDAGCFDPMAGHNSRAATYRIRWISGPRQGTAATCPTPLPVQSKEDRSNSLHGEAVQFLARDRSNSLYGKRSNSLNGISIKTDTKTSKTTAPSQEETAGPLADSAPVAAAVRLLVSVGFDLACAKHLAGKRPLDAIQRQIDWLPLRNTTRNRLGLLRRAIEGDWPKPEGGGPENADPADTRLGKLFATHYYAAYHGQTGEPTADPFAKDLAPSAKFVERLMAFAGGQEQVPEWGRRFGRLVREKHRNDGRAKPYLASALTLYGDEFVRSLQREVTARQKEGLSKARELHQVELFPEYMRYLETTEKALQAACPARYEAFLESRRQTHQHMNSGRFSVPDKVTKHFESAAGRLQDLADVFRKDPEHPVLDFWQWDGRLNPRRFGTPPPTPPEPEAHP